MRQRAVRPWVEEICRTLPLGVRVMTDCDCRTNPDREECPLGSVSDWRVAFTVQTLGGGSGIKVMRVVARSHEDALSRVSERLDRLGIVCLDSGSAEQIGPVPS